MWLFFLTYTHHLSCDKINYINDIMLTCIKKTTINVLFTSIVDITELCAGVFLTLEFKRYTSYLFVNLIVVTLKFVSIRENRLLLNKTFTRLACVMDSF